MPKYNHRYETDGDGEYEIWTNRNGTETHVRFTPFDNDDDDGIPYGCVVCGNHDNYPECREGCLD